MNFFEELQWRGLVHQCTDLTVLQESLNKGAVTLYCGFDPTAQSLHVGSLVPLVTLRRFNQAGHKALALVGGATGLVGDPSGKSAERVLQSEEQTAQRAQAIAAQVSRLSQGEVVNNLTWTKDMTFLEVLRDVGKHFSVNAMIRRDSVSSRLEREGDGLSFTEFSYMLLQAMDFWKLSESQGCSLQIGGSDQWGNMVSGVDLIRRKTGAQAMAMTMPLLTMADGQKFGKTANGAVWLDAQMTSPWDFFQFWLNTADADVIRMLKLMSFVAPTRIMELERSVAERPESREAQQALAFSMTELVHGAKVTAQMQLATAVLFQKTGDVRLLEEETLDALARAVPLARVRGWPSLAGVLVEAQLEASKSKASQVVRQGGVSINNQTIDDPNFVPEDVQWLHNRFLVLKKGKKSFALVERVA